MTPLDWTVVIAYIGAVLLMGFYLARRQQTRKDYYLAGRRMGSLQVALSLVATQVSAISIIGAPAFIALKEGGGLKWWQYEFAVPLAMIVLMLTLVPLYHKVKSITIYGYLEGRYGRSMRMLISAVFLISRGLGAGVVLFATGIVLSSLLKWPLFETLILVALITVVYTTLGGITADIYSDILQLFILWFSAAFMLFLLFKEMGLSFLEYLPEHSERLRVFITDKSGLGDGESFALWPMLLGGFFLYLSYYGTDQSEAQRLLTTPDARSAQKALFINGMLRFPLVLTYSFVGVLLLAFLSANPEFLARLEGKRADMLVPEFVLLYFPPGLVGLFLSGVFAATMSSIDSAMNALSAATYEDFLTPLFPRLSNLSRRWQMFLSKLLTVLWGVFSTAFALTLIRSPETVIEIVNRIGSAFYGPILAVFVMGMFVRRVGALPAAVGLAVGVLFNLYLWKFQPGVSWMWWNAFGFLLSSTVSLVLSYVFPLKGDVSAYTLSPGDILRALRELRFYVLGLLGMFLFIALVSLLVVKLLT